MQRWGVTHLLWKFEDRVGISNTHISAGQGWCSAPKSQHLGGRDWGHLGQARLVSVRKYRVQIREATLLYKVERDNKRHLTSTFDLHMGLYIGVNTHAHMCTKNMHAHYIYMNIYNLFCVYTTYLHRLNCLQRTVCHIFPIYLTPRKISILVI